MSSRTQAASEAPDNDLHMSYVNRLRALKEAASVYRRVRSSRTGSLIASKLNAALPLGDTSLEEQHRSGLSRLTQACRPSKASSGRDPRPYGDSRPKVPQELHLDVTSAPSQVPKAPGLISAGSRSVQQKHRGGQEAHGVLERLQLIVQMKEKEGLSLRRKLDTANSLLSEANTEIHRLREALSALRKSKANEVIQQKRLSDFEAQVSQLQAPEIAKEETTQQLASENKIVKQRCRRYRKERDIERRSVEGYLLNIQALEARVAETKQDKQFGVEPSRAEDPGREPQEASYAERSDLHAIRWQGMPMLESTTPPGSPPCYIRMRNGESASLGHHQKPGSKGARAGNSASRVFEFVPERSSTPHGPRMLGLKPVPPTHASDRNGNGQGMHRVIPSIQVAKPRKLDSCTDERKDTGGVTEIGSGRCEDHCEISGSSDKHDSIECEEDYISLLQLPLSGGVTDVIEEKLHSILDIQQNMRGRLRNTCKKFKELLSKPLHASSSKSAGLEPLGCVPTSIGPSAGDKKENKQLSELDIALVRTSDGTNLMEASTFAPIRRSSKLSTRKKMPQVDPFLNAKTCGEGDCWHAAGASDVPDGPGATMETHCEPSIQKPEERRKNSSRRELGRMLINFAALHLAPNRGIKKEVLTCSRQLTQWEIRRRELFGWPQPAKKRDVFDA